MNLVKKESSCCGCSMCVDVCPHNAITLSSDPKGFLVPVVNVSLCVECGLCEKLCDFKNVDESIKNGLLKTYACKHKQEDVRNKSRSGGVFVAIAKWVTDNGGVVYGAAFNHDLSVVHMRAETYDECLAFQGSKYVQSDVSGVFKSVIADLNNDKIVLFSGTACQVAGLKKLVKVRKCNPDKLITCDIICHGVVSPKMYKDYLRWCEKKHNGKITEFNFRDKSFGWSAHIESFVINEKKYSSRGYTELYYSDCAYRKSCVECKYTTINRASDFTLADCWGAEKRLPEMYDNKGLSLLLVNSDKALEIYNRISDQLEYVEIDINDFLQPQLQHPIRKAENFETFWNEYDLKGFDFIVKKYGKQDLKSKLKRWIKWKIFKNY